MTDRDGETGPAEEIVLVLQGGGALGAYQAGAYEALAAGGQQPAWLAGISIGAINAAIIAGNPPERRVANLRAFWEGITAWLAAEPWLPGPWARELFSETGAAAVLTLGVPGFFAPRLPPPAFMPTGTPGAISYCDTAPLAGTLLELVELEPHPADHRPLSPASPDRRGGPAPLGEAAGGACRRPGCGIPAKRGRRLPGDAGRADPPQGSLRERGQGLRVHAPVDERALGSGQARRGAHARPPVVEVPAPAHRRHPDPRPRQRSRTPSPKGPLMKSAP